jgi:hypothetical protein
LTLSTQESMRALGTLARGDRRILLLRMHRKIDLFFISNTIVLTAMTYAAAESLAQSTWSWGYDLSSNSFIMLHTVLRVILVLSSLISLNFFKVRNNKVEAAKIEQKVKMATGTVLSNGMSVTGDLENSSLTASPIFSERKTRVDSQEPSSV